MATENIDIKISESGSRIVKRNLEDIGQSAVGANSAVDFLKRSLGMLGAAFGISKLIEFSSAWSDLTARVKLAAGGVENGAAVMERLQAVATRTYSDITNVTEAYLGNAASLKELGYSTNQTLDYTEALANALVVSGAKGERAATVTNALNKAMAQGKLSGMNWQIVLQQGGRVVEALAQGMGKTVTELRAMAAAGKGISSDQIFKALSSQMETLRKEADAMPATIVDALGQIKNKFIELVGTFGQAGGMTDGVVTALLFVRDHLETIIKLIAGVLAGFLAMKTATIVVNLVTDAIKALNIAIATNPIGFLVTVLISAIALLTLFRDEIKLGTDGVTTLGDLMRAMGETIMVVLKAVWEVAQTVFGPLINLIKSWVGETDISLVTILKLAAKTVDGVIGAFRGSIFAIIALFQGLPAAMGDIFTQALNVVLDKIGKFVNAAGEMLSKVTEFAGLGKIAAIDLKLDNKTKGAAAQLGKDVGAEFQRGWESSNYAQNFLSDRIQRAQEIGAQRAAAAAAKAQTSLDKRGKAAPPFIDPKEAKEAERFRKELDSLVGSIDKVWAAQHQLEKAETLLSTARSKGLVSAERSNQLMGILRQQLQDALDPMGALNRKFNEEQAALKMTNDEREISTQLRSIEKEMLQQGIILGDKELAQLRQRLIVMQQLTNEAKARNKVEEAIKKPMQDFRDELVALNQLVAEGKISQSQATAYLAQSQQELFAGTTASLDALVAKYQESYAKIDAMQQAGIVTESQANQMRMVQAFQLQQELQKAAVAIAQTALNLDMGTWADTALVAFSKVTEGFTSLQASAAEAWGNFFTSFTDGFANSVGRAIVYSEDLGSALKDVAKQAIAQLISALVKMAIQWAINAAIGKAIATSSQATAAASAAATGTAIASSFAPAAAMVSLASFGANSGPAIAGIMATTAVAEMASMMSMFKEGGFTGNVGINDIAGLVHGQEFVTNAQATRNNRPVLEAMNRGAVFNAQQSQEGGTSLTVTIENYGSDKSFDVQQISESDVRVIARDVVRTDAPNVIANEINNANSNVSKSLARSTNTERRR
jgi:tape measure domain-containing protein